VSCGLENRERGRWPYEALRSDFETDVLPSAALRLRDALSGRTNVGELSGEGTRVGVGVAVDVWTR
jgi:hypothetical protein